jgi:hypothetical protein
MKRPEWLLIISLTPGLSLQDCSACFAADWAVFWENDQKRFRTLFGLMPEGCPTAPPDATGVSPRLPTPATRGECDSDRYYTNGLKVTVTFADRLPWGRAARPGRFFSTAIVVGQSIYTPADIETSEVIHEDRPYGGWLYGGISTTIATNLFLHTAEIDLGVVGPNAAAGPVQKAVHYLIRVTIPRGWDNQIGSDRPFYAFYRVERRHVDENLFLDAFPSRVQPLDSVWDQEFGIAFPRFRIGPIAPQVTWRLIRRTNEFRGQPKPSWFGSFTFN